MTSVAKNRVEERPAPRLCTLADLAAMPSQIPSGPARWELWDGELRLMPPMGDFHGSIQTRIGTVLTVHGEWEGHGRGAGGDVGGVSQPASPQPAFGSDVIFLTPAQWPARQS